jgi:hypothetical protein
MRKAKPRESKPVMRKKHKYAWKRVTPGRDHFMKCPECGSLIDLRDLEQVMRHHAPGHAPEARDTVTISSTAAA